MKSNCNISPNMKLINLIYQFQNLHVIQVAVFLDLCKAFDVVEMNKIGSFELE